MDKPLGIFTISPEVIRTKTANDIATVVHEAGHFIQKELFGGIDWKPLAPFRDELRAMATKPRAGQSPLPEGFAEFVAKYVVDPAAALRDAPKFYEHFENQVINQAPEFGKALLNAREAVKKWAEQPAAQEVLSHISIEGREGEGFLSQLLGRDTWDRLYTNFLDRLYPLKKATDLLAAGVELPADMNPYTLARTFAGALIDGKPYTVGFVIREDVNGKRYYDRSLTEIVNEGQKARASGPLAVSARTDGGGMNASSLESIVRKHRSVKPDTKAGLMQSAYESRDLMDFSRRGRLTNSFNIMTAFFNASLQGLDRTARGAVENPRRFIVRGGQTGKDGCRQEGGLSPAGRHPQR
jgi:hypothetical protein